MTFPSTPFPAARHAAALCLALPALLGAGQALADDHGRALRTPVLPLYAQECGSCHVPYPPGLLPSASWQRLMNDLPHHFGTDASLDANATRQISVWLAANAATSRRVREEPPQDRITRSAWFMRKHDEVPADAWKRASVKSAANCSACHAQADQGDFDEHRVRIPR